MAGLPAPPAAVASSDNASAASSEEFPLQEPRVAGAAEGLAPPRAIKHTKPKRFSLRSIARPFVIAAKMSTRIGAKEEDTAPKKLKSARKSIEGKRESRETRRVSFSPSTDVAVEAREDASKAVMATDYKDSVKARRKHKAGEIKRSSSYNDSIGRQSRVSARKRAVSFTWDKSGVHLSPDKALEARHSMDKGRMSQPRISRQQAIAARHARALEQIINAGASLDFNSVEVLKAKREKKLGGRYDKTKVQMIPAVSPRKVISLKRALLDTEMANGIIAELRTMQVDERCIPPSGTSMARDTALDRQEAAQDQAAEQPRKKVRPAPTKAICLDCTEEEAIRRHVEAHAKASQPDADLAEAQKRVLSEGGVAITTAAAASVVSAWGLGGFFKAKETTSETTTITDSQGNQLSKTTVTNVKTPASEAMQYAREIQDDVANGDVTEAMADLTRISVVALKQAQPLAGTVAEKVEDCILSENKELPAEVLVVEQMQRRQIPGMLSGVSPISLIMSPISGAASVGLSQVGAYDALGTLSGYAIQVANGGQQGMEEIHPPLDRMAIFVRWWGFEMTLPHSSMAYLSTAQSVSASFLTFLQTMVVTGGVPELLPFVRYFSSFMDMEFSAIKSQDKGHGVVVAATWLMPMALVPRPWDYPTTPVDTSRPSHGTNSSPPLPARLSSIAPRTRRSPSPSSVSSQERHASASREAGIASASLEGPSQSASSHQAPPLDVLASLQEVPEGSMRLKA